MANLMNESQLERYAAQLEESQADRDCRDAWRMIMDHPGVDYRLEYRYSSLVTYLGACVNVAAGV